MVLWVCDVEGEIYLKLASIIHLAYIHLALSEMQIN